MADTEQLINNLDKYDSEMQDQEGSPTSWIVFKVILLMIIFLLALIAVVLVYHGLTQPKIIEKSNSESEEELVVLPQWMNLEFSAMFESSANEFEVCLEGYLDKTNSSYSVIYYVTDYTIPKIYESTPSMVKTGNCIGESVLGKMHSHPKRDGFIVPEQSPRDIFSFGIDYKVNGYQIEGLIYDTDDYSFITINNLYEINVEVE